MEELDDEKLLDLDDGVRLICRGKSRKLFLDLIYIISRELILPKSEIKLLSVRYANIEFSFNEIRKRGSETKLKNVISFN